LAKYLKAKGGVFVQHHQHRRKQVKADVGVEGIECDKAKSLKGCSVLVGHDDLALLELLLLVNHDGIKIKGVDGGGHVVLLICINKKKVIVNYLANEIEGGVRVKQLSAGDKHKASNVYVGNDKGFRHFKCILLCVVVYMAGIC
jgi:hypothetical protein